MKIKEYFEYENLYISIQSHEARTGGIHVATLSIWASNFYIVY